MAKKNGTPPKEVDAKKKKTDPEITESVEKQEEDLDIIVDAEDADDDLDPEVNGNDGDVEDDEVDESGEDKESEDENDDDEPAADSAPESNAEPMPIRDFLNERLVLYRQVQDDEGEMLPDDIGGLYHDVKQFSEKSRVELTLKGNIDEIIDNAVDMGQKFEQAVDKTESLSNGTIASYRVIQGRYFNQLQQLFDAAKRKNWTTFLRTSFPNLSLRSIQDYKLLARVPNIQEWTCLGVERLLVLVRVVRAENKQFGGYDPIEDFLQKYGFRQDQGAGELSLDEVKNQVNTCIIMGKLSQKDISTIPRELVERFLSDGRDFSGRLLGELDRAKQSGMNLVGYLEAFMAGKADPVDTPERKAETFNNYVAKMVNDIIYVASDDEALSKLNTDKFKELEDSVRNLKMRLTKA